MFTQAERLILANQHEILMDQVKDENSKAFHEFCNDVYKRDLKYLYIRIEYLQVPNESEYRKIHDEVCDLYYMFINLAAYLHDLSEAEKESIEEVDRLIFDGFDTHEEEHYWYLEKCVEVFHLFRDWEDIYEHVGVGVINRYRAILARYKEIGSNDYLRKIDKQKLIESLNYISTI